MDDHSGIIWIFHCLNDILIFDYNLINGSGQLQYFKMKLHNEIDKNLRMQPLLFFWKLRKDQYIFSFFDYSIK